jgi:hypothetical protein
MFEVGLFKVLKEISVQYCFHDHLGANLKKLNFLTIDLALYSQTFLRISYDHYCVEVSYHNNHHFISLHKNDCQIISTEVL